MWECLELDTVVEIVVDVVGCKVVVKTGRMNCVHAHVPVCVGQVGEVGSWVWSAVVLIEVLSDGWKEGWELLGGWAASACGWLGVDVGVFGVGYGGGDCSGCSWM